MKNIPIILAFILVIVALSCSKKTTVASDPGKATIKEHTITYALNIQPLIQSKCTPCHIPANGGFKTAIDTYDAAKDHIDNILTRIQLTPADKGYMPFKKTPLSSEEIAVFKKWKEEGMLK